MNSLFERLLANGPAITDGAWGTELQARGLAIGACPDAWNLTSPDLVAQVAEGYVAAGSRIILTNTFGATAIALQRHGLAESSARINSLGAAISKSAAGEKVAVFGSMGPCGRMLAGGDVTVEDLRDAFHVQAAALAEGGANALIIETMSDLDEASVALAASMETGLPVVVCMTYGSGKSADRTMMGVTPEQAAGRLMSEGADAIGANCGQGAAQMLELCARLKIAAGGAPIWIKPNAGLPRMVDGRAVYDTPPSRFTADAEALVNAGANFIGGCCGTSPAYIAALVQSLSADTDSGKG